MPSIKNSQQNKVIAFLVHGESPNLKKHLRKLNNIIWGDVNKEAFDLCKAYTKLDNPEFDIADFLVNEHSLKGYVINLLDIDNYDSEDLGKININKLINIQEEEKVRKVLSGLEGKSINEVLRDVKDLKGVQTAKPLNLADVKRQRLIDREYEKLAPSTGFKGLDEIIKGFVSGHTITMTGDTNVGKTQASCNFAYNVAKQGKRVLYFSLEPDITVIEYLASIWSRKRFDDLTDEDLTPPTGINIDVYTKEHVRTLTDMVNIVENSERYDLVIIDHFGYFTSVGNNKTQVESNAMKTMASFSKRNKTCVLIVVHPRKSAASAKKRTSLSIQDISGSAAFSQDATDVLIIMRKKDEDDPLDIKYTGEGYVAVHKTKAGPNGAAAIRFVEGSALIIEEDIYAAQQSELF